MTLLQMLLLILAGIIGIALMWIFPVLAQIVATVAIAGVAFGWLMENDALGGINA